MRSISEKTGFASVLRNNDFACLWMGQAISNAGDFIGDLALLFFVFELTHSPIAMALLGMMQISPRIFLGGIMGIAIDRWNRKHLMILADVIRACVMVSYPAIVGFSFLISPEIFLYCLAFISATADTLFLPARNASIPNLVSSEDLVPANSLCQTTYQIIALVATPLGGVLVTTLRPNYTMAFLIDALSFIGSAVVLTRISTSLMPCKTRNHGLGILEQLTDVLHFVKQHNILISIMLLMSCFAFSTGVYSAIMIPFFEGELNYGAFHMSLILTGTTISGILAGALLGRKTKLRNPIAFVSSAVLSIGIILLILSLLERFLSVLIIMSLSGALGVAISVGVTTLIQEVTHDDNRGMVFSLHGILLSFGQILGLQYGGFYSESIGSTRPAISNAGVLAIIAGFLGISFALHISSSKTNPVTVRD
jgi:MFS family permease